LIGSAAVYVSQGILTAVKYNCFMISSLDDISTPLEMQVIFSEHCCEICQKNGVDKTAFNFIRCNEKSLNLNSNSFYLKRGYKRTGYLKRTFASVSYLLKVLKEVFFLLSK
jgi:hypothetical protein